jgi:protein SCO1
VAAEGLRRRLPERPPPPWFSGIAVALVTAVLIGGCGAGGDSGTAAPDSEQFAGMTRNPPLKVDGASLPNVNPDRKNRDRGFRAEKDGLMLAYFGYTFCPDVCPTTLADLRLALAELDPDERDRVEVAMTTVDPERDTAKVLDGYLGHFFPKGSFAAFRTTDADRLARVEREFNAAHEIGPRDEDGSYEVSHTAQIYAVDENGTVRVEWPFGTGQEEIAGDLKRLLSEQSGATSDDTGD